MANGSLTAASYVPASDAIAIINVKRMLNETMPSILGSDAAKLAQANAEVDKFKTKTGFDLRSVDHVVLGVRYTYPRAKVTKLETVAIAYGNFDARAVAAAVHAVQNGNARDEKYRGATITVITVNDDFKLMGLWNVRPGELAICALDQNYVALGSLARVRAAIDAGKAGRAPADLVNLATQNIMSVIGFAANTPPELLTQLDLGTDSVAKDVSEIRQVYGSVVSAEGNVTMTMVARTTSLDAAKNLSLTVDGLRQIGGFLVVNMTEPRKTLAQTALNNLKITPRGSELEISTQVTAASLAALIK